MEENSIEVRERADSIEISKNGKGEYSWKIKLYYSNLDTPSDEIINKIEYVNTELKKRFR